MAKKLIELGAVLAIVLFLASGCASSTLVNEKPFDFSTMRKMEAAGTYVSQASQMVKVSDESKNDFDMAWAYYHAGQVAVAEGDFDKAKAYFDKALDTMTEVIAYLKELLMKRMFEDQRSSF